MAATADAAADAVKVVLLDIEGTVCPISFVQDVLFPYALKVLPETVKTRWDSPEFKKYRDAFPTEYSSNQDAFEAHVIDLVTRDVKVPYLKSLQGFLWEEGYKKGDLKAPLFKDVPPKLSRWHGRGFQIMIYSSGSVPAQKLLFQHTDAEPSDLTFLISDWFDTVNAGLKTETASYQTILSSHPEHLAGRWLFLSDNVKEVDAAIAAGMQGKVVQRPGNAELPADVRERLDVIESFDAFDEDFNVEKPQPTTLGKRDREPDTKVVGDNGDEAKSADTPVGAEDDHAAKKAKPNEEKPSAETKADAAPVEPLTEGGKK